MSVLSPEEIASPMKQCLRSDFEIDVRLEPFATTTTSFLGSALARAAYARRAQRTSWDARLISEHPGDLRGQHVDVDVAEETSAASECEAVHDLQDHVRARPEVEAGGVPVDVVVERAVDPLDV